MALPSVCHHTTTPHQTFLPSLMTSHSSDGCKILNFGPECMRRVTEINTLQWSQADNDVVF
jgi:hypothetical protein